MIILKNADYHRFITELQDKRITLFGAGGTLRDFLKTNENSPVLNKIDFVLDNNAAVSGKRIYICNRELTVMTVAEFLLQNHNLGNYVVILLLTNHSILNVVKQLDEIPQFNQIPCYYGQTALQWGREVCPPLSVEAVLPENHGNYKIPQTIHYCWFGEKSIPKLEQECIASWSKYCTDYEIRFWNESNYDLANAPLYVRQAYEAKKYAFVSDYVRLDVVYKYGGIYFDTDVFLLNNIDSFLNHKAFFCFESLNLINTGLAFGSIPHNPTLNELINLYKELLFLNPDGTFNLTPCPEYHTDFFRRSGVQINNSMQCHDDTLFLPSDYFCAVNQATATLALTSNSRAYHRFSCSWFDEDQLNSWNSYKANVININERLLSEWKREEAAT